MGRLLLVVIAMVFTYTNAYSEASTGPFSICSYTPETKSCGGKRKLGQQLQFLDAQVEQFKISSPDTNTGLCPDSIKLPAINPPETLSDEIVVARLTYSTAQGKNCMYNYPPVHIDDPLITISCMLK